MHQNELVLFKVAHFVWFDLVFLDARITAGRHSTGKATSRLLDLPLSKKICTFDGPSFIGGFEYHPVAKVERKDLGFFLSKRRNERRG